MTAVLVDDVGSERYNALLLGPFAGVALLLAAVGMYGVMAYAVSRRTAEIGIRMALGAPAGRVFASVVGRGLALSATGATLGLLLALALSRLLAASLSGMLFEVSPTDPVVFTGVPLLLLAVSLLACAVPARRAARVDPWSPSGRTEREAQPSMSLPKNGSNLSRPSLCATSSSARRCVPAIWDR